MTKVYDTATDLITFARSSSGTALRRVGYGDELVVDGSGNWVGDFDVAADLNSWADFNSSSSYASGSKAISTTYGFGPSGAYMTFPTEAGKIYQATAEVVSSTGYSTDTRLRCGNGSTPDAGLADSDAITAPGAVSVSFVATGTTSYVYLRNTNAYTTVWDNISVKEVIFDRATDDLVLFNHPDDIPRIEYAADGSLKGLLIEEQRTNLITTSTPQSGDLDTSGGSFSYVTCNFTPFSGPGIYFDTTGVTSYTYFTPTYTAADYTLSVFVEMDDGNAPSFGSSGSADAGNDFVLVTEKSAINPLDYTVEHYGGNTYRVSATRTSSSTTAKNTGVIKYGTGSNRTFKVTGYQLEEGSFATSYIPTSGSQQTRSADLASIPVTAFGYNQDAGTVVVEASLPNLGNSDSGSEGIASLVASGSVENIGLYKRSGAAAHQITWEVRSSNTNQAAYTLTPSASEVKIAYSFAENDFNISLDGALETKDTSGSLPSGVTDIVLGNIYLVGGIYCLNGHIKSIQYYPRRLTNAQLQELTA